MMFGRAAAYMSCGFRMNGKSKECVNLGSYNYLGFADDWHETCKVGQWVTVTCCELATERNVLHAYYRLHDEDTR